MSRFIDKIRSRIFYDVVDGQKVYSGGLLPDTPDSRDFQVGSLWGLLGLTAYKPLHTEHRIDTISFKNQNPFNTCGWFSKTIGSQARERTRLSARALEKIARKNGYVSGDVFSNLRDNMLVVQKFGIPEESMLPDTDITMSWEEYSKWDLTQVQMDNAYRHRSQSFWSVSGRDQILRALDEGKTIHTGLDWYNEYNMRGGFKAPWIIKGTAAFKVGGHAVEMVGYDLTGRRFDDEMVRLQNSYGTGYGDGGDFWIPMKVALQILYSKWVELDIPVETGRFLQEYNGLNVRGKGDKAVYFIRDGQKLAYPDWLTFLAYGGIKGDIQLVDSEILAAVPNGEKMDITISSYWPLIKEMAAPDNYKKLLELTRPSASVGAIYATGSFFGSTGEIREVVPVMDVMLEVMDEMRGGMSTLQLA